jgi:hypothetical protein
MNRSVILAIITAVLLACCCVVVAYALISAGGIAAVVSAPAPYNIDKRSPVPAGTTPGDVFPPLAYSLSHQYEAAPVVPVASFAGVVLPEDAKSVLYTATGAEQVQMFAVQTTSGTEARQLVAQFEDRVESSPGQSHRYRNLPGQKAFVQWHVASWREHAYGIVWNNGEWIFGTSSTSEAGRDAVADFFPY